MNSPLTTIEAHLQYVTTRELENARQAELLKIVRANQPGPVSTIIANLRISIGTMLVTVGERLQAKHDAIEAERLHQRRARAV